MAMAQRLTVGQSERRVNALQNFRFTQTEVFRAKRHFFLHAESTAGELQIGRLLHQLDGRGSLHEGQLSDGGSQQKTLASNFAGQKIGIPAGHQLRQGTFSAAVIP